MQESNGIVFVPLYLSIKIEKKSQIAQSSLITFHKLLCNILLQFYSTI